MSLLYEAYFPAERQARLRTGYTMPKALSNCFEKKHTCPFEPSGHHAIHMTSSNQSEWTTICRHTAENPDVSLALNLALRRPQSYRWADS
jgi:hypothetical protein